MALLEEFQAVYEVIIQSIKELFGKHSQKIKYKKQILSVCLILAVLGFSYLGYRWYVVNREQKAQQAFSEYMQDYFYAVKENNPEWDRVGSLFSYGHNQYSSSYLAPYFLSLQADVQLKQGQTDQAIATLQKVIEALPSSSPLLSLIQTKKALIQLDSNDQAMQENGVQTLVQLARNTENKNNDIALFYLGQYYWSSNKIEEATKIWQELVDNHWFEKGAPSPWVQEARSKLQQLTK